MSGGRWSVRLAAACLASSCVAAQEPGLIASVGYFYVGGVEVRVADAPSVGGQRAAGGHIIDQVGVLRLTPAALESTKAPVVMAPGFGLAGHIYLETADGRPGWAAAFLSEGRPVYVLDRAHTARTGFDVAPFNRVREGRTPPHAQPALILWLDEQIWTRWGLGPRFGAPFMDGQFPIEAAPQLVAAFTATPVAGRDLDDQAIGNVEGLLALLERIGPAVLLTHSASGRDGFDAAQQRPDLVRAIVAVEPVGCPSTAPDALLDVPILSVFGDHLEARPQMIPRYEACRDLAQDVSTRGGRSALLDLPALGVRGNSHIMMSDRNSEDIVGRIRAWLARLDDRAHSE